MYLQDFAAGGALTQDTADQISWKTAEYNTKIVLVVDHRRLYAHLLSLCWDELDIRTGTPMSIVVGDRDGGDDDEDRRALVDMVDYIREMTGAAPTKARRRRRFSFH
ncbi:MAG: hypothetical protein C0482_13565 [Gordonia sp.]|uniref:Resolvase/invertase-type recombinase catalytic domain-containing protein n=1 Tax=Gordonia rubripertincta TaxID=36822 RepID=A0ABT4N398_GORRU|nr:MULTISPECIES: hypothetical protein [Mycobacteriales]MBA4023385.1 hypothetical protein [Gordonia sp. (in: high G+C Gram-positive bacteria)]MCZ4553722.1 hypothetical protein [Gordonia rubripertincta]OZG30242.1 hypothetical protein BH683_005445 [Williamsia sp. 1138]